MNLRYQKPIFQYIQKKVNPNVVLGSDGSLGSKLTQKSAEVKKLDIPPLRYAQVCQKENMSDPIIERSQSEIFKGRQNNRKQSVDSLLLYDRIDKKSIAVNITYVSIIKNQGDLQLIQAKLKKKNLETVKDETQNSMKQIIKEEEVNKKKRASISTKIKLGNLIYKEVAKSQEICS